MKTYTGRSQAGFTLVEIMLVVAIIALLAATITPGILRSRKRAQASRVLEDLRLIDHAVDQYAVDYSKPSGTNPRFDEIKPYFKKNSLLYSTGRDIYGSLFGPFTVDSLPTVPPTTKNSLSDVADTEFWSPYQ